MRAIPGQGQCHCLCNIRRSTVALAVDAESLCQIWEDSPPSLMCTAEEVMGLGIVPICCLLPELHCGSVVGPCTPSLESS